jgi:type IV pilus assembly protein PilO
MAITDALANAPRPQKVAAGVLALVVVAGIGYFSLSPKRAERDMLQQRNEALQAEVLKARADEANLRPFRAQAEGLRRRLEVAKGRLPSEREIPALYRQLSDLAHQSGLGVALFAPKAAEDRDSVAEIPIAVTAEGTYHQLGSFFSRMGRIPRIVNVGDFRVAAIERPTGTLRADLTLATYLFRPEGAAPPPPAAAGTPPPQPPQPAVPPIPGPRVRGAGQ